MLWVIRKARGNVQLFIGPVSDQARAIEMVAAMNQQANKHGVNYLLVSEVDVSQGISEGYRSPQGEDMLAP